jgi:hypothetical protein
MTLYECSPNLVPQQIVSVCGHDSHLHHGSAYVTLVAAFAALGSLRLNPPSFKRLCGESFVLNVLKVKNRRDAVI